jgi:hypothetical protein
MSAVDLPPGIGLAGTPLGTFRAPVATRRRAWRALIAVFGLGAATWALVSRHPGAYHASTQVVLPVSFLACAVLGVLVRSARVTVTRDGVRWGWRTIGFHQEAARIATAHVYADGVALEARRGSWWFLAARDWDRFDALVRQLRRSALPIADHDGAAPLRARLQSYGRFLDALLIGAVVAAAAVAVWAS